MNQDSKDRRILRDKGENKESIFGWAELNPPAACIPLNNVSL